MNGQTNRIYRPTYLLVVEDTAGVVNIAAVQHPDARLHYYTQQGLLISRQRAIAAPASAEIYDALRRRFAAAVSTPTSGFPVSSAWFVVEFEAVVAAIREYDLRTGLRVGHGVLEVGTPVRVEGLGLGTVKGFSACGRIAVALERFPAIAFETLAPASMVLPA